LIRLKIILCKKRGGQGDAPLGLPSLWGREGITLIAAAENYKMTGKRGVQQSPYYPFFKIFWPVTPKLFSCRIEIL